MMQWFADLRFGITLGLALIAIAFLVVVIIGFTRDSIELMKIELEVRSDKRRKSREIDAFIRSRRNTI